MLKITALILTGLCTLTLAFDGGQKGPQDQDEDGTGLDVAAQMKNCAKCHETHVEEWKSSRHASSWTNPVFQAAIKDREDKGDACARCHASDSVPLVGQGELPKARAEHRDLGVNCLTCHMDGKKYYGPLASKGHGGIVVQKEFKESIACAGCHGRPEVNKAHDQYTSFIEGPMAARTNCQECHMPAEDRPMTKSKKKLKDVQGPVSGRVHTFEGITAKGKSEEAAAAELEFEDKKLHLTIGSRAGHAVPASEGREVRMELTFHGEGDKVLATEKKVWDYKDKNYITAKGVVLDYDLPAGTKKAVCKLVLVMTKAPGRDTEIVLPIATEEGVP